MVKTGTRRLRTLRGGGTASYGFVSPPDFSRTINNGFVASATGCGAPSHATAPLAGGGLPGLNMGAGVSLQKGGGGGTHYGFNAGGLAGGNSSYPSNCALSQSGASGQLNVPQNAMGGGRRRRRRQQKNTRKNKSRRNKQSRRR